MGANRVFTAEELEETGTRRMDTTIEAVEAGDKEKAKKLIKGMHRESWFLR